VADTTLIIGLAGIAGTVIGASMGPITQRRTERTRRRDKRRQWTEKVLRAVRMIDLELGTAQHWLIRAVANRRWFQRGMAPRFDAWDRFAADVAGALDPGSWRELVRAHTELQRISTMYEALHEVQPNRDPEDFPFDDKVASDLQIVITTIQHARILVRPINLGGSTFPPDATFWFPETPELGPWALEDKTRLWRRKQRRKEMAADDESDDPKGSYAPMPYGMIFVPTEESRTATDKDASNASTEAPSDSP
jgi:hypothetical protein